MTHNYRSHAMDGLKLLFMLLIVVHHSGFYSGIFHHGYVAVDLFFMISGYFLQQTLQNKPHLHTGSYFLSRLRKLYPHHLFSFLVMFLATEVYRSGKISAVMLLVHLPEVLLVQNIGIFTGNVNYPCWYMSVLVFASLLVFYLGKKLPVKWFGTVAAICAAVVYSFILCYTGGSMETFAKLGVFYLPFWRGMAGLFCGSLLFLLHKRLCPLFARYSGAFRVLEIASLLILVSLMFFNPMTDGLILICIFLLLLCIGSGASVLERLCNCAAVKVAIRYEYPGFLNHAFVIGMVKKLFSDRFAFPPLVYLMVLLVALVIYSVITEAFVRKAMELLCTGRKKVSA